MEVSQQVSQHLAKKFRRHTHNHPPIKRFTTPHWWWRSSDERNCPLNFVFRSSYVLLRISEVEKHLSVSKSTIYRLIGTGHFDVVHVEGSVRITSDSLESYITTHTTFGSAVSR